MTAGRCLKLFQNRSAGAFLAQAADLVLFARAAGAGVVAADLLAGVADRFGLLVALLAGGDGGVLLSADAAGPPRRRRSRRRRHYRRSPRSGDSWMVRARWSCQRAPR